MGDKIERLFRSFSKAYGVPSRERREPVDELVLTILSQNTSDTNSLRAFADLKNAFPTWDAVADAHARQIEEAIHRAGLSRIKSARIRNILRLIRERESSISLDFLGDMTDDEAFEYLVSFNGVGAKTAACVLLFSFGRPIMPVDTHVYRVASRLGLIGEELSPAEAQRELSDATPDEMILPFHLQMVAHGRALCRPTRPKCDRCMVSDECLFYDEGNW